MKKTLFRILPIIIASLFHFACSSASHKRDYPSAHSESPSAKLSKSVNVDDSYDDEELEDDSFDDDVASEFLAQETVASSSSTFLNRPVVPIQKSRKIYYDGKIDMIVDRPDEILDKIEKENVSLGGYTESRTPNQIIFRVPVAHFRSFFDGILTQGEITNYEIEARDITDQFQDLKLRQNLLQSSLARFQTLLKRAKTTAEKVALLKEINKLKEKLRYMKMALTELNQLATFSKLTLSVGKISRKLASTSGPDIRAFQWIQKLDPNSRALATRGEKLDPPVPDRFVRIKNNRFWESQTSSKSSFWASVQKTDLEADSEFWLNAIENKLQGRFSKFERYKKGKLSGIRFEDGVGKRFSYHVIVMAKDDEVFLFESTFPTLDDENAYIDSVYASISSYMKEI